MPRRKAVIDKRRLSPLICGCDTSFRHRGLKRLWERDSSRVNAELRSAYVTAESDVPFGEVVELVDVATKHLDHVALVPRSQVLDRQPQPGEIDVCMGMSVSQLEVKTPDRHLSLWHQPVFKP